MHCCAFKKFSLLSLLAATSFFAHPHIAHAGFEWTPPTQVQRSAMPQQRIEPQQPQLTNQGPLTPEPVLAAPVPNIEPLDGNLLSDNIDMPPPAPQTGNRMNSTALPAPVEQAEILDAPQNLMPQMQQASVAPSPQVFVPQTQNLNMVDGFGRRIPLSLALKQIVPPLYVYKFENGVSPKQKVSWQGGDIWTNVLNEMLDSSDLSGELNGNVITISKGAGQIVQLPQQTGGTRLMPTSEASLMGGMKTSRVVDLSLNQNWQAAKGTSLREALNAWARQAGVKLEWQSQMNYPITSAFNFEGSFAEAVDSLLSLYADDNSPPKGKLYPNRPNGPSVLVVESL